MCGLGSITFSADCAPEMPKFEKATSALLEALDHRGRDACGYMTASLDGVVRAEKAPLRAKKFNEGRHGLAQDAMAVAVHTRLSTKGDAAWNQNNHPVAGPNGALVIHNGIVYDSDITRSKGDPQVDTFALAHDLGTMRSRHHNEKDATFARRIVRTLQDREGSQTAQVMFAGSPMLVSARVKSNPLYQASIEAFGGECVVTASTSEAVRKAVEALGFELPTERRTFTKLNKKGKQESWTGMVEEIFILQEGEFVAWFAGTHYEGVSKPPASPSKKRSYGYAPGGATTGPGYKHTHGKASTSGPSGTSQTASTKSTQPNFFTGDVVKLKFNGVQCEISKVERNVGSDRIDLYVIDVPEHKGAGGATIKPYTGKFNAQSLELVTPFHKAMQKSENLLQPTPLKAPGVTERNNRFRVGDRVRATTSKRMGVVIGIEEQPSMGGSWIYKISYPQVKFANKARSPLPAYEGTISGALLEFATDPATPERVTAHEFEKIVASIREQPEELDRCELCNVWSSAVEIVEDVTLCPVCAESAKAWENAGIPRD